jgi:hypothetical protein
MPTADDNTQTAPPQQLPQGGLLDPQLQQLIQQFTPQPVQVDQTPVSRGWLSRLGEALGGGKGPVPLSPADEESAGLRALMGFGTGLMAASRYQPGQTIFSNLAQGFQGAQRSMLGSEELSASTLGAQQGYQQQQAQNRLEALKVALPLLQTRLQQQASGAQTGALGGNTPGTGTAGRPDVGAPWNVPEIPRDTSVTAGQQANNSGNLMAEPGKPLPTGASGVVPVSGGRYVTAFPDVPTGIAAQSDNLAAYQKLHGIDTIAGAVKRWVNDPKADLGTYTADVAKAAGVAPDAKVDLTDPNIQRAFFIAQQPHESGKTWLNPADVDKGIALAAARRAQQAQGGPGGPPAAGPRVAGAPPPAAPNQPPAPAGSGFGASAFAPPSATVLPAPATTADAPNTTAEVPSVPTPQMVAARAAAARSGKPVPIAGTDGLFANPNGTVGSGPGAGGLGKRADIDALMGGVQTAQTTIPPPAAATAGPGAGGGVTPAPAPAPAPASAFGGAAFATAPAVRVGAQPPAPPATTAPTPAVPVPPSVAPAPPTPGKRSPFTGDADIPDPHETNASYPSFVYRPTPGLDRSLPAEAQAQFRQNEQQLLNARAASVPGSPQQKDYDQQLADLRKQHNQDIATYAQAQDTADSTRQLEAFKANAAAWNAIHQTQITSAADIAKERIKAGLDQETQAQKSDQERYNTELKDFSDQAGTARMLSPQYEQLRAVLSDPGAKIPSGIVGSILQSHPTAAPYLAAAGVISGKDADQVQLINGLTSFLSTEMRPKGSGSLRGQEMTNFQKSLPTLTESAPGRQKALAFLLNYNDRVQAENDFAQEYYMRPKAGNPDEPTRNTLGLQKAMDAPTSQGGLGEVVPHMPAGMWNVPGGGSAEEARNWIQSTVQPGRPYWGPEAVKDSKGRPVLNPDGSQKYQLGLQVRNN